MEVVQVSTSFYLVCREKKKAAFVVDTNRNTNFDPTELGRFLYECVIVEAPSKRPTIEFMSEHELPCDIEYYEDESEDCPMRFRAVVTMLVFWSLVCAAMTYYACGQGRPRTVIHEMKR
jgi:hypothetical protein